MDEATCLSKMISPGMVRPSKPYLGGVIQVLVTSSCDKNCLNCTQMSQLRRKPEFMTPEQFETALESLKGYWGVVGVFGGNPALSPHFEAYCQIMRHHFTPPQRGIWCNNPLTVEKAKMMRQTFHPGHSNLNVHLDQKAFDIFKEGWPECHPVGLTQDSRHSPCFVAMKDVLKKICPKCNGLGDDNVKHEFNVCEYCNGTGKMYDIDQAHELISNCDVNQKWSAAIGLVRGQLRGFFCEIGLAQAVYHQDEADYPDTGLPIIFRPDGRNWWQRDMSFFQGQVRKHCHECSVPLRGHGENAMSEDGKEQVSQTHAVGYEPKRKGRPVEVVTELLQLGVPLVSTTAYLQNASTK